MAGPGSSVVVLLIVLTSIACGGASVPFTPLAAAARAGDLEEIDRLIVAGADVNEPSGRNDWPPLIHAIHKGRNAAVVRLLTHGAALEGGTGRRALLMASGYGEAATVRLLLARGVHPGQDDRFGAAVLSAAVGGAWDIDYDWTGCERHTEVVRALLARDPGLRLGRTFDARIARWYTRWQRCDELVRMVAE